MDSGGCICHRAGAGNKRVTGRPQRRSRRLRVSRNTASCEGGRKPPTETRCSAPARRAAGCRNNFRPPPRGCFAPPSSPRPGDAWRAVTHGLRKPPARSPESLRWHLSPKRREREVTKGGTSRKVSSKQSFCGRHRPAPSFPASPAARRNWDEGSSAPRAAASSSARAQSCGTGRDPAQPRDTSPPTRWH